MASSSIIAAVKVVPIKQEELREILLEVEILQACKHDNVVKYFGTYMKDAHLWICMELCAGGAVDSMYRALPTLLNEEEIATIIGESVKGLAYLHQNNLIHRDIKSGNLLLTSDGHLKLADFGVSAQLAASNNYRAKSFIGTPYWMAPEVIMTENSENQTYDQKADIWSIGITVIELADKSPPLCDIHPMRALYLIPTATPDMLMVKQVKKWSKNMIMFILACLVKEPKVRMSATKALEHQFLRKTTDKPPQEVLSKLLLKVKQAKEATAAKNSSSTAAVKIPTQPLQQSPNQAQPQVNLAPTPQPNTTISASNSRPKEDAQLVRKNSSFLNGVFGKKDDRRISKHIELPASKSDAQIMHDVTDDVFDSIKREGVAAKNSGISNAAKSSEKIDKGARFEPVSLDIRLAGEVYCADIIHLKGPSIYQNSRQGESVNYVFLLVGTKHGLYSVDVTLHDGKSQNPSYNYRQSGSRVRDVIPETRFKDIQVLEDYHIMLAIAGKHSHVRVYTTRIIKKILKRVFNIQETEDEDLNFEDLKNASPGQILVQASAKRSLTLDELMDQYQKLLETKESKSFVVQRTRTTIYVGVVLKEDIIIFEWAKMPYLKFMKVKKFWLPETPKFIEICHDGEIIRDLIVVYEREANMIGFESSAVTDIVPPSKLTADQPKDIVKDKSQFNWVDIIQLPLSRNNTVDQQANTAVARFSTIHNLHMTKGSNAKSKRYYLGTYGSKTAILDATLSPVTDFEQQIAPPGFPTKCVKMVSWAGTAAELKQNRSTKDLTEHIDVSAPIRTISIAPDYVLGFHKNYVEIMSMSSGNLWQIVRHSQAMRLLTPSKGGDFENRRRGRYYMVSYHAKKKYSHLYWLCEAAYDLQKEEQNRSVDDDAALAAKVVGNQALAHGRPTI